LPLKVWEELFAWLAGRAQETAALAEDSWRGLRLVMIDGFTVSMPSTPELVEAFGRARCSQGVHRFPLARAVAMALANSMALIGYRLGRYDESENALAQEIQGLLRSGDLLIGDRRFAGAHYYAAYLARGIQFLTRAHQGLKLHRLPRLQLLGPADFITSLRLSPDHRRTHPEAPATVIVRMIQVEARVRGKRQLLWLVTSLLDAQLYSASEIAELYSRRWRIETLIEEIKIGLGADVLRSLTPEGIRKEFAARMLATNVMRMIILDAALQHRVDPLSISFKAAVRTVLAFAPALSRAPVCHLPAVYHGMLQEIAAQLIPHRPGRNEPRCIRRERQRFPRLKIPRAEWRRLHAS
jgi:putative transposase